MNGPHPTPVAIGPRGLMLLLMAVSAGTIAGFLMAALMGQMALAATLALVAFLCGCLTMLVAMATVAGPSQLPQRMPLDQPGKHIIDGTRVLHLPEVNP